MLGCGTRAQFLTAGQPCASVVCQVEVSISGQPPKVSVDLPELALATGNYGQGGNGVVIVWHLNNPQDYEFRDDSIQFYDPAYSNQFDQLGKDSSGAVFKGRDKNRDGKKWGYMIKVYDRNTGYWYPLDPWIYNG